MTRINLLSYICCRSHIIVDNNLSTEHNLRMKNDFKGQPVFGVIVLCVTACLRACARVKAETSIGFYRAFSRSRKLCGKENEEKKTPLRKLE